MKRNILLLFLGMCGASFFVVAAAFPKAVIPFLFIADILLATLLVMIIMFIATAAERIDTRGLSGRRNNSPLTQSITRVNRGEFTKLRFGDDWAIFNTDPAGGGFASIALEYNPDSQHFMLYRVRDENAKPKKQRPRFSMADMGRISIDECDNYALFLGDRRNILACCNSTPDKNGKRELFLLSVPPTTRTVREAVAWTYGVTEKEYLPLRET